MDKVLSAQIAARNRIVISGYKSRLMDNPDLTMYDYCKEQNINYSRLIGWMGRHGVSVIKLRHELRKETECSLSDIDSGNAFIQFVPSSRTTSGNLQGISITFPDGVNLSLQESSVESVISLLTIDQSRHGGAKSCSD